MDEFVDARFEGTYLVVENALGYILKLTMMRGHEVLAGPIEEPKDSTSSKNFFNLCCRDRVGNSIVPGHFLSYHMVVFNEKLAREWFDGALTGAKV